MNNFKTFRSLKEAVAEKARKIWDKEYDKRTNVKYVTDQLWKFKNDISKGDVFIIYSESRIFGIAEVTDKSKYHYKKFSNISFAHQINVKYKWYEVWPKRADDKIVEMLGKQGTLKLIEEDWIWDCLIKKLP